MAPPTLIWHTPSLIWHTPTLIWQALLDKTASELEAAQETAAALAKLRHARCAIPNTEAPA
eukprot:171462-Prymnesium_polylepis.1